MMNLNDEPALDVVAGGDLATDLQALLASSQGFIASAGNLVQQTLGPILLSLIPKPNP